MVTKQEKQKYICVGVLFALALLMIVIALAAPVEGTLRSVLAVRNSYVVINADLANQAVTLYFYKEGTPIEWAAIRFNQEESKFQYSTNTGSSWSDFGAGGGASQLSDLSDVGTVAYDQYKLLIADGVNYDSGYFYLNYLYDVYNNSPADKHVLIYDGVTDNRYENVLLVLGLLSDVSLSSPANGESLVYNGASWINQMLLMNAWMIADMYCEPGTHPQDKELMIFDYTSKNWQFGKPDLGDLDDVNISGPSADQFLGYSGGNWINRALTQAMIADLLHDAVKIQGVDIDSTAPAEGEFYRYSAAQMKFILSTLINAWMIGDKYLPEGVYPDNGDIMRFDYALDSWKYEGLPGDSDNTMLKETQGSNVGYDLNADQAVDLDKGGTGVSLTDPGMNKLFGWNDTTNAMAWVVLGTNLAWDGFQLDAEITPAGDDKEIQLNISDAIGTDADFYYDYLTDTLYGGYIFKLSDGTYTVGLQPHGSMTGNLMFTLPSGYGTSGQGLKTDGSGGLNWGTIGDMMASEWDTDSNSAIDSADGGTNKTSWTAKVIPWLSGTNTWGEIVMGAAKAYLRVKSDLSGYEWDLLHIFKTIECQNGNYFPAADEDSDVHFNDSDNIKVTGFSDTRTVTWEIPTDADVNLGEGTLEIPNVSSGDVTVTEGQIKQKSHEYGFAMHDGNDEVFQTFLRKYSANFVNPNGLYDIDQEFLIDIIGDEAPNGITVKRIDLRLDGSANEVTASLCYCTDFQTQGDEVVIDVVTTSSGKTTITSGFDNALIPNGKELYLKITADPSAAITQCLVKVLGTANED